MNYLIRGTEQWDEEHRHLLARKLSEKLDATYYRLDNFGDWDTLAVYGVGISGGPEVYANCLNTVTAEDLFIHDLEIK